MTELLHTRALDKLRQRRIRILVTNDDGIHAPGLKALEHIAHQLSDDVWVVAPEQEQSGASHSLTLHMPLRLRKISERRFGVHGTPTDCVMMAIKHVIPKEGAAAGDARLPDLVLSGVNRGSNIADDVTYSGTVAGAMEGCVLGVPSIALSQAFGFTQRETVRWSVAEHHGPPLIAKLVEAGWPRDVLININFPDVPHKEVSEIVVTAQGRRDQHNTIIDAREDARGQPYYWLAFERKPESPASGTDLLAIYEGKISVTPLHLNLTYAEEIKRLTSAIGGAPARLED